MSRSNKNRKPRRRYKRGGADDMRHRLQQANAALVHALRERDALTEKLRYVWDTLAPFDCGAAPVEELARRAVRVRKERDEARALVKDAFDEGFERGVDHGNIEYKYPPFHIAWQVSGTREKLTGEKWVIKQRYDWITLPDDPDVACVQK